MNVLSVIYHPVFSGPHNRTTIVAKLLADEGIHTTVVLPDEGAAALRMRDSGIDVITMPLHRMRAVRDPATHLAWARSLTQEVRHLATVIEERKIDVVATNTLPNLHGGLAARRAGVACVWQLIDTFSPPLARRIYMPIVHRLSDVVMTTGVEVARQHPGVMELGERWVPFFPSVDVAKFAARQDVREAARTELGIAQDATVIGNVAAMSPMKGHVHFIRAAAKLRETHPDLIFVILGSEQVDREDYYRDLWAEAERLGLSLGSNLIVRDPGTRVPQLAQAFDMFWMTSEPHSEGIPTAIGEAKALGLPVVTTDVGATRECVADGVSGYVVAPQQPDAIAAAARRILEDEPLRRSMSVAARAEAIRDYASQRGAEQHRIAYQRAIDFHRSGLRRAGIRRRTRGTRPK